jgi:hypothetical protein
MVMNYCSFSVRGQVHLLAGLFKSDEQAQTVFATLLVLTQTEYLSALFRGEPHQLVEQLQFKLDELDFTETEFVLTALVYHLDSDERRMIWDGVVYGKSKDWFLEVALTFVAQPSNVQIFAELVNDRIEDTSELRDLIGDPAHQIALVGTAPQGLILGKLEACRSDEERAVFLDALFRHFDPEVLEAIVEMMQQRLC